MKVPSHLKRSHRGAAFTLIETIVGILLVCVLGAMGFAGLKNAMAKTRSVECFSKMRNLSQSVLLYAQDQGSFPKTAHSGGSWAMAIAPYMDEPTLSLGSDYRDRKAFTCPANLQKSPDGRPIMSYAMNVFFELTSERRYTPAGMPIMSRDNYPGSPATWHKPNNIPHPARTVLLAENANAAQAADHFMAHQWNTVIGAQNAIDSKRHLDRSNFAFADGHIESLEVQATFDPATGLNRWNPSLAGQ